MATELGDRSCSRNVYLKDIGKAKPEIGIARCRMATIL